MNPPWKKILASLVGPLALTALTLTTAPSAHAAPQAGTAAQGTVWEIWNNYNGLFLTDWGGDAIYAIAGNDDPEQLWHERAGYKRSNAKTGYCLDREKFSHYERAVNSPCNDGDWQQQWFHHSHPGGVVIKTWDNHCLTSGDRAYTQGVREVTVEPCRADKRQLWSVRAVF